MVMIGSFFGGVFVSPFCGEFGLRNMLSFFVVGQSISIHFGIKCLFYLSLGSYIGSFSRNFIVMSL